MSELGNSKSSSGIGGTSEVSDQYPRISIESNSYNTNDLNGGFTDHEIDVKMDDIDNNNEKFIDRGDEEGDYYFFVLFLMHSIRTKSH